MVPVPYPHSFYFALPLQIFPEENLFSHMHIYGSFDRAEFIGSYFSRDRADGADIRADLYPSQPGFLLSDFPASEMEVSVYLLP